MNKNITLIAQVIGGCNLGCRYCYIEDKVLMKEEIFQKTIEKTINYVGPKGKIDLIYHGGEPLLRGIEFYKFATKVIKDIDKNNVIHQSIQSNGTLLNEEFVKHILDNNISFGLSMDGPKNIHDANRVHHNGKGSFDETIKGKELLNKYGLNPSAISVISKIGINNMDEIYNFFKSIDMNFKVNPVDLIGKSKAEKEQLEITPKEYGQALIDLFNCWFYDPKPIVVENLKTAMHSVVTGRHSGCTYSNKACGSTYISLNPYGDVFPCNRFTFSDEFKVGNIMQDSIESMFDNNISIAFKERLSKLDECKTCEYTPICNGGCTSRAYSQNNNINTKDHYCISTQMLFKHIEDTLLKEIDRRK